MIPPAKHGGRKRSVNVREVLNGIFYVLSTGCQWNALPKELPPKSTVSSGSSENVLVAGSPIVWRARADKIRFCKRDRSGVAFKCSQWH